MGLDMTVLKISKQRIGEAQTDFQVDEGPGGFDYEEWQGRHFWYWRKHPDLHGWFGRLYRTKGGADARSDGMAHNDGNFAGPVRIDLADIDALEAALKAPDGFPVIAGFFFGSSNREKWEDTGYFVLAARAFLKANPEQALYYEASW